MYFTSVIRFSPEHGRELRYYKIKESFRDVAGRVHTRLMLTPGYMPDFTTDEIVQVRIGLSYLWQESATIPGGKRLFDADPRVDYSEKVCKCIESLWEEMKEKGTIDAARNSYDEALRKSSRLIDVNTIKHRDCCEVGAENVCLQAIRELQLSHRECIPTQETRQKDTLPHMPLHAAYHLHTPRHYFGKSVPANSGELSRDASGTIPQFQSEQCHNLFETATKKIITVR